MQKATKKTFKKEKTKKYIGKNKKIEKHTEMSSNIFGKKSYTREGTGGFTLKFAELLLRE